MKVNNKWKFYWILIWIFVLPVNLIFGLAYMFTLPIVLNIGLTIFFISHKGIRGIIWLLQIIYWVLAFSIFGVDHYFEKLLGSILLAELQLGLIYQKFGRFYWTGSWGIIIGLMYLRKEYSNVLVEDILVILEIAIIGIIVALMTMLSLEKGFMSFSKKQESIEL